MIDTTIPVRKITYKGTELPLAKVAELNAEITTLTEQKQTLEAEVNSQIELRLEAEAEAKMWKADAVAQNELRLEAEAQLPIKYQEGHADGVKSEYDRFWDKYQFNGENPQNCDFMFAEGSSGIRWVAEITYRPKYKLKPTSATSMYYATRLSYDLLKRVDFSNCTNFYNCFSYSPIDHLGVIDMSKVTKATGGAVVCDQCNKLVTIDKVIFSENTKVAESFLRGCSALVNLIVEGVIACNNLTLSYCPLLSHDSLMTIINCLQDKTGDTSGTTWKVTLGSTNKAKLTDAELQIAYSKNWAVA